MLPEPKYHVGQLLILKCGGDENTQLFVTEIDEITCATGKQIYYKGSLWVDGATKHRRAYVSRGAIFNEIEILGVDEHQREHENEKSQVDKE